MDKQKPSLFFSSLPYMQFDLAPIDDPKFGRAKLCGVVPFLLPFRGHTMEEIMGAEGLAKCKEYAVELIETGRSVWPDEDDEEVIDRLYQYAFSCTIMSGMSPFDPRVIIFINAMVLIIAIDDAMDKTDDFSTFALSYREFMEDFRTSEWIFKDDWPNATADVARMLEAYTWFRQRLLALPDFMQKYQPGLKKEIGLYVATNLVLSEMRRKGGISFSDSTTAELIRNVGAPVIGAELISILRDAELPEYVRKDVLFQVVRTTTSDIEVLMNAIFGLPRDIRLNQIDSPIVCPVVEGRMNLQTACNKIHADLLSALHDFKIATDKLLEVYPDNRAVAVYVDIVRNGMDGMLYSYKFVKRYRIHDQVTIVDRGNEK